MAQAYAKLLADLAPVAQYAYAGPDKAATDLHSHMHYNTQAYPAQDFFPQVCSSSPRPLRRATALQNFNVLTRGSRMLAPSCCRVSVISLNAANGRAHSAAAISDLTQ